MEYVEGEPLVSILDREVTLSPQRTLDVLAQAGEGLSAAHQAASCTATSSRATSWSAPTAWSS